MMGDVDRFDDFEVKRANIRHHNVEAEFFKRAHPESSSLYEKAKVSESIAFIVESSRSRDLCVDVGCGTGFVTDFELPFYVVVVEGRKETIEGSGFFEFCCL